MRRISVALVAGALVLAACSGGGDDTSGDADAVRSVATELAEALTAAAADRPEEGQGPLAELEYVEAEGRAVAAEYDEVVAGMNGIAATVEVAEVNSGPDRSTATLEWSWPVAETGSPWTYATEVALDSGAGVWQVVWERSVVEPSLGDGEVLEATTAPADRGDITGAGGKALVTERPVVRFGIDRVRVPAKRAPGAARALARLVDIDVAPYVKAVRDAGDRAFVEAITFRKAEVPDDVMSGYRDIRGAVALADDLALAPTREFAAALLGRVGPVTAEMVEEDPDRYQPGDVAGVSGLQQRYDEQLAGTAGRVVEAVAVENAGETRELYRYDTTDGDPLALTLDRGLQTTAEDLLSDVGPASALVALRPSNGAVLAAANGPGTGGQNYATYGQLPPGSTFKIVSSLALLRAGLDPDATVRCPATLTVDGKEFGNYTGYPSGSLGAIPLRTAVAQSCNTAFISARGELGKDDLAEAARSLGLGVDHDLGFPAYFGSVEPASGDTEAAANLIGQGTILASPMAMAAVIASVQQGGLVVPRLVRQVDVEPHDHTALTDGEAEQLQAMLRQVVTEGSGSALADVPGPPVIAKTGTAEFQVDDGIRTHAWMVAAQGDLAVAVFVEVGESGSSTAGPILEDFLRAAGS